MLFTVPGPSMVFHPLHPKKTYGKLAPEDWICEPCLWTSWTYCGKAVAGLAHFDRIPGRFFPRVFGRVTRVRFEHRRGKQLYTPKLVIHVITWYTNL